MNRYPDDEDVKRRAMELLEKRTAVDLDACAEPNRPAWAAVLEATLSEEWESSEDDIDFREL